MKSVLLAALLHDLGQFPMAHEIEEYFKELKHEKLTIEFLKNPTLDVNGFTLKDIIENNDWGWGINVDDIVKYAELDPALAEHVPGTTDAIKAELSYVIDHEIVCTLSDLILCRTDFGVLRHAAGRSHRLLCRFVDEAMGLGSGCKRSQCTELA